MVIYQSRGRKTTGNSGFCVMAAIVQNRSLVILFNYITRARLWEFWVRHERKAPAVACKLKQTMLSYRDLTKYFGARLSDEGFQSFIHNTFSDLTEYDILKSDYITSEKGGVELGFTNNEAVYDDDENINFEKGNPIFSHFILYPKSLALIDNLPIDTNFDDNRIVIVRKAGNPTQTKQGYADFLKKNILVDNYKMGDIVITFDYDAEKQTINFIQVRYNHLVDHLKL